MKKTIWSTLTAIVLSGSAYAEIIINTNPSLGLNEMSAKAFYLNEAVKKGKNLEPKDMEIQIKDGKKTIALLPDSASLNILDFGNRKNILIYAQPEDKLTVNIESIDPLNYSVTGSELMEGITSLNSQFNSILNKYDLTNELDEKQYQELSNEYTGVIKSFIEANPGSEAIPYAILQLQDDDEFLAYYQKLTSKQLNSPVIYYTRARSQEISEKREREKKRAEMTSGSYEAPDFTFKNTQGKNVSLSDFRGKWVIIDFWGTWCPWCIKGFPELKTAYEKYKPELEIIGIACNDPYENWIAGVKKYDLPWVNLYNPEDRGGKLLEDYLVEGFPTKAIVTPDGKIANITTGHNPDFFNILDDLLKKQ